MDIHDPRDNRPASHDRVPSRQEATASGMPLREYMHRELASLRPNVTARELSPSDGAGTLHERLRNDIRVLEGVHGLTKETWASSRPVDRAEVFREAERAVAKAQGREPHRLYVWALPAEYNAVTQHTDERTAFDSGLPLGRFIRIEQRLLVDLPGKPASFTTALEVLTEEIRHAYQLSVIKTPGRHPEVDDAVRKLWYAAYVNYPALNASYADYVKNELEVDAKRYARVLTTALHDERF